MLTWLRKLRPAKQANIVRLPKRAALASSVIAGFKLRSDIVIDYANWHEYESNLSLLAVLIQLDIDHNDPNSGLAAISSKLDQLLKQGTTIMAAIDDLKTSVANLQAAATANAATLTDLASKITAANSANDPAIESLAQQVQAVADSMKAADTTADPPATP